MKTLLALVFTVLMKKITRSISFESTLYEISIVLRLENISGFYQAGGAEKKGA